MRRRTITAVSGNYSRQPHIARSRVGFAQRGVPICLPPFDPLLVRRHDADSMPTRQFVRSWTGKLSFSRVEQLLWSLLRSWLRPHRGISQDKLPLYLGFFQFVHNARRRDKALLGALVGGLVG